MLEAVYLSKKVKIEPTKGQKETIDFWMRRCKVLYNLALEERIIYYKATGKTLSDFAQTKELVDIKDYDKSWRDIPNKVLSNTIFRLGKSYKSFFNGAGFPKYKSEVNTIEFADEDIRLRNNGKLYLPKIKEPIKCRDVIKYGWRTVKLIKEDDKYYLILLYKEEVEIDQSNNDVLGVDLGLKELYTDSNGGGSKRFSKKLISKYHRRIVDLNRSLSTKKRGSKKRKKVKKHLSKAHKRLTNTKNDYLHKSSLKLVRDNKEGIICVGDIDVESIIKNNKSKKGLIKSFYINSLGIFKRMVSYKAVKYGKICLLVDERNTSRTCSCCGNVKNNLSLSDRIYNCNKCKKSIDRDLNAAINIKSLGSSLLSNDSCVPLNKGITLNIEKCEE